MAGATYDVTYGFGYNPASQMTMRSTSNDPYLWTGDVNVSRNYAVNGLNQYISAGPASFSYDANGNLTGDGSNAYVYDVENRLVSASGASSASLRYDPLGRLYETSGGAAGTTRFLYDGDELVAEYAGAGNMLRRYVHGSGSDDPMAWFEGASVDASAAKMIKINHQGSVIALTDWYGNLTSINSYDEWGIPAASNTGRFQYTGQAWIPELRMYHYKARIYSPTLGRFLQTDPIGYDDQVNLYAYVGNDPVNMVDPTGMYECTKETGSHICHKFKGAQSSAISVLAGKISVLQSLQSKVSSGGKLNSAERGAQAAMNKYMKASDVASMGRVIKVAQGALADLRGSKAISFTPEGKNAPGASTTILGVRVNTDRYSPLPRGQGFSSRFTQALIEEAIHSSTLSSGNYIRDNPTSGRCIACYATPAYAQEIAQRGDPFANAANYVFALGMGVDP